MKRMRRLALRSFAILAGMAFLLLAGPLLMLAGPDIDLAGHWSTADRSPAGLAPLPDQVEEAVVQVYAARAYHWRGAFGVHTWIASKAQGAEYYRVYEVTRWRGAVNVSPRRQPDRAWYGNPPQLLADYRGARAARLVPRIAAAAAVYPQAGRYRVWPGPNSNTFTAWLIRQVPELQVVLPPTAIGKDFLLESIVAAAPSKSGYQLSLGGMLGVLVAREEGIELNLLGLTFGIDFTPIAILLPGVGRLGLEAPVPEMVASPERLNERPEN